MTDQSSESSSGQQLRTDRAAPAPEKHGNETTPLPVHSPGGDPRSQAQLYQERINQIWLETVGADVPGFDLVRTAVRDAGFIDDLPQLADLREREESGATEDGISGNVSTVNLLLPGIVEPLTPAELQRFVRSELSLTIARLEREGASREGVVDIVIRALRPLGGSAAVSTVARRMLGYLTAQIQRDSNYYLSVDMAGDLLARHDDADARRAAVLAYHVVVRGMWEIARSAPDPFAGANRHVPSTTLASLAQQVAQAGGDTPQGAKVARDLLRLSAVTAEGVARPDEAWSGLLAPLGLHSDHPADVLTVLNTLGKVGDAWTRVDVDRSAIEAYGAVAAATVGEPELVPARLFNAGVSIIRSKRRETPWLLARVVVNLVGLRWAIEIAESVERLEESGGLSCLVNFIGAVSDLREVEGESQLSSFLIDTVRRVANLPANIATEDRTAAARIAASLRNLKVSPLAAPDPAELVDSITNALNALTPALAGRGWSTALTRSELIMLTAAAVGQIYQGSVSWSAETMITEIRALVAIRATPDSARQAFTDGYQTYASGVPDGLGQGPLVAADLLALAEWVDLATDLLRDPGTMTPSLRAFNISGSSDAY